MLLALSGLLAASGGDPHAVAADPPEAALRADRAKRAARPRMVFDNDGMDAQFLATPTADTLLTAET